MVGIAVVGYLNDAFRANKRCRTVDSPLFDICRIGKAVVQRYQDAGVKPGLDANMGANRTFSSNQAPTA